MINSLTKEQEDSISEFRDKWLAIGLNTDRIDYEKAIAATKAAYVANSTKEPRFFLFPDGPKEAMKMISAGERVDFSDEKMLELMAKDPMALTNAVREKMKEIGEITVTKHFPSFYSQHEAGWLGFHDFFYEHFGLSELTVGLRELAKHSGWVWMYEDIAVIAQKPIRVTLSNEKLHNEKQAAIEYADGTKVFAFNGTVIPEKWVMEKETIDPSEILACNDVDQRAAGVALLGYARLKDKLNYNILDGDPNTDIGALVELTMPGLSKPGRFLEAICPRNGPVFLGIPYENPWDGGRKIKSAVAAQAFLAGLSESAYQHPLLRT